VCYLPLSVSAAAAAEGEDWQFPHLPVTINKKRHLGRPFSTLLIVTVLQANITVYYSDKLQSD